MSSIRTKLLACASAVALLAASGVARAVPSTSFTLSGAVVTPGTYDLPALEALPRTTLTASYLAGGTPVTDTYTGVTLWNLLGSAGGVVTDPSIKNDILRKFIIGTGTDGYKAVIALGEIAPNFGNRPYLAAYTDTGGQLTPTPGPDGFARFVLPGDVYGGRYVSNLASVQVGSAPRTPSHGGGISSSFTLSGRVANPGTYTLSTLQTLPATTETATYLAAGTPVTDTYTGVNLWTLLSDAGILTDPAIKNDILRFIVVATGSDGYSAVFSLGEIDPMFGNQPDLVAYADTGGQLGANGPDGFARMVVPGDVAGGRYVSNLVSLEVLDATAIPESGTVALLILPFLGLVAIRALNPSRRPS